jgi:hypothetical protein
MEVGEHTELSVEPLTIPHMPGDPRCGWCQLEARVLAGAQQHSERARLLYEAENKANEFVMAGDALVEAVLYKLLYARGLRIASIDADIKKALDQRLGIR